MAQKAWIHKLSFNLSHVIVWRLAVSLTFGLLVIARNPLVAGMSESRFSADPLFAPAQSQDLAGLAAMRKTLEGEALLKQRTAESRRLAAQKYEEALQLWRAARIREGEAATLTVLGLIYSSLGENQKALDYYAQALPIYREVGYLRGEAGTLSNIAFVKRDLGRFDESRSHIEAALKVIESIRAKVDSKELRASYFATEQVHYKFYIDLLMRLSALEPAKGHGAAALQVSERARARSLIESLAEARADIRRGVDAKLIDQEKSLQQRLNAKAEETLKLSASGAGDNTLAARRREIDALTIELQQVQTQIRQSSPRYAA